MVITVTEEHQMTKSEAKELTKQIKESSNSICEIINRAYQEKIWIAIGYVSFVQWGANEIKTSRAKLYRVISQGQAREAALKIVSDAIEGTDKINIPDFTQAQSASISKNIEGFTQAYQDRVDEGQNPEEALKQAAKDITPKPEPKPKKEEEPEPKEEYTNLDQPNIYQFDKTSEASFEDNGISSEGLTLEDLQALKGTTPLTTLKILKNREHDLPPATEAIKVIKRATDKDFVNSIVKSIDRLAAWCDEVASSILTIR